MDSIRICGGTPLHGSVRVQGSKNAALPILAASAMLPGESILHNCPDISDVRFMCGLMEHVGCQVRREKDTLIVDASGVRMKEDGERLLPAEYVGGMRSSVVFLGAMLGRCGQVSLQYPGGCVIGKRPIDLHLSALKQLGADIEPHDSGMRAKADRLKGSRIRLPVPSVGATENVLLAAVCAEGTTILEQAAQEPEIYALCDFLRHAGGEIFAAGGRIQIEGKTPLHGCEYTIPADRIVAGTYLLGCMAAGGEICLRHAPVRELDAVLRVLTRMGGKFTEADGELICSRDGKLYPAGRVRTEYYPGYPTDLQSPLLSVMTLASGGSFLTETIFENRFHIVRELNRMGAEITIEGNTAAVPGGRTLHGVSVRAMELRGGAALVVAGLAAEGETIVTGRAFIDRGYEDIAKDFRDLGAKVFYEEYDDKDSGRQDAPAR